jgi:hypothetical protein
MLGLPLPAALPSAIPNPGIPAASIPNPVIRMKSRLFIDYVLPFFAWTLSTSEILLQCPVNGASILFMSLLWLSVYS